MDSRRAALELEYQGKNITEDIRSEVLSASYEEGFDRADTVSVSVQDRNKKWLLDWRPQTGDSLRMSIGITDWEAPGDDRELFCGTFTVDELEYSGWPGVLALRGNSLPVNEGFIGAVHSRTWQNVTVRDLFLSLLPKGFSLQWEAPKDILVSYAEQSDMPDLEYISGLAQKYGLRLKLLNSSLVVWDAWELDAAAPARTFLLDELQGGYTLRKSITRTQYGACRVKYQSAGEGKELSFTYPAGANRGKVLEVTESVTSLAEAELVARGALWFANAASDEAEFTLPLGDPSLYAGKNIELTGAGDFDGVYGIDASTHEVGSGGYSTALSIHKVQREPATVPQDITPPEVGDTVNFSGGLHYNASEDTIPVGGVRTAGTAKLTKKNEGARHPYHLFGITSDVYGWVDAATVSKGD